MANTISTAFTKQYERDVHIDFQRVGSKLISATRSRTNVKGSSTNFRRVGKGTAGTKGRNGLVPVMNPDHSMIECVLTDHYAGEFIDDLDEEKLQEQEDERQIMVRTGSNALGRKQDEIIILKLDATTNYAGNDGSDGLTKAKALAAIQALNGADVPDDGQRFAAVGEKQWTDLYNIQEFADADYVGDDLPFKATGDMRFWLGVWWMRHTGLTLMSGSKRRCHMWHKTAVGTASGKGVKTDISWENTRSAHFVNNRMSQGACVIDATGVVSMRCLES
ncbi:phage capsid protein [Ferrovibrio terrae]|uniref:phage capsid protein n=1 Tax=Ferrovibrio terrae TaxID=2594003 RepID=UPI0031383CE5